MEHIESIRGALDRFGVDAMLIMSEPNRRYALDFPSSAGALIVTGRTARFFVDSRYTEAASRQIRSAEVCPVTQGSYSDGIQQVLAEENIRKLGFEESRMSYADYKAFAGKLRAELVPAEAMLQTLRASKSREELAVMREAQAIAEKAYEQTLPLIAEGITEKQLAAELVYRMLKLGAENVSFDPIIVSGVKSSMPHGVPGDVPIGPGFLTMDFGVLYKGYCSDTTRTVCVGRPTEEMVRVYDTVLQAQLAGIAAAKPGARGCDVDGAGRRVIEAAGYGAFFGHSFGHSLGLEIHESPNASPRCTDPLPEGAVISAEPGIYLPGRYGVRIEDVLYLTGDGCENLTSLSKSLTIL